MNVDFREKNEARLYPVPQLQDSSVGNKSLLEVYQPETCVYFANRSQELLASPPFASLLLSGMTHLAEQADESLKFAKSLGFANAIVVGAIPFDCSKPGSLRVSTNIYTAQKCEYQEEKSNLGKCEVGEFPLGSVYRDAVKNALARFARGELDKVVLSRTLNIKCEKKPCVRALVKNLATKNTNGYTFAVNLPGDKSDFSKPSERTLIGASPELLVSCKGNKVLANPLAGSEARHPDPEKDKAIAEKLLHSEKDLREHALVIKAIKDALSPLCKNIKIPDSPSLINTATMWHLSTKIEAELKDSSTSSLDVALAMHPTPAVCGFPTEAARRAIGELEPHERNLFTGMVGWCDGNGDGEWVVTIRCAEVEAHNIQLYAGAGIVAGSCPDKELAETGAKFNTMLQALGI